MKNSDSSPRPLTARQREGLRAIYDLTVITGQPPTIRAVVRVLGIASPHGVVEGHLLPLWRRGLLAHRPASGLVAGAACQLAGLAPQLVEGEAGQRLIEELGLAGPLTAEEWDADCERMREAVLVSCNQADQAMVT